MKDKRKKILAIVLIALVLLLGAAAVYVTLQLQRAEVPTAPVSRPRAAEWLGGGNCNVSFTVAAPSCNNTCSTTVACATGLNCVNGACRKPACTEETDCICPEAVV